MRFTLPLVRSGNEDETEEQFDGTWVERAIPGKVMGSAYRQYDVTPEVIEKARKLGMYGAVERRLKKIARLAARINIPGPTTAIRIIFLIQTTTSTFCISATRSRAVECGPGETMVSKERHCLRRPAGLR